jgi:hypothetical protein
MPSAIYYASDLHVDHKANMEFLLQLKAEHYHEVRLGVAPDWPSGMYMQSSSYLPLFWGHIHSRASWSPAT